jgi:polysaccharide export outer membrane protein
MRIKFLGVLLFAGVVLTSCVSRKQLTYLQSNDEAVTRMMKAVPTPEYRLQTNDIISLKIKALKPELVAIFNIADEKATGNAAQSRGEQAGYYDGFTVDERGNIRIPMIGEMYVMGSTLDEVRVKIEKELLDNYFNKEANIFVLVKMAGLRFTINGEITSPGTMTMFQEKVTILEAIANRGDITIVGDRKNVTIIRQYPYGTEMHDIDLTDIKVMESPYYYLQPNDYIYIKPLAQKTWGTGTTGIQSLSTIVTLLSLATTTYLLLTR